MNDSEKAAVKRLQKTAAMLASARTDLLAKNAKLREQMERLVTLLRVDCDIDASWDELRRFWSIELTEDGCLMRDRACKAEAENVKLRRLLHLIFNQDYNDEFVELMCDLRIKETTDD